MPRTFSVDTVCQQVQKRAVMSVQDMSLPDHRHVAARPPEMLVTPWLSAHSFFLYTILFAQFLPVHHLVCTHPMPINIFKHKPSTYMFSSFNSFNPPPPPLQDPHPMKKSESNLRFKPTASELSNPVFYF